MKKFLVGIISLSLLLPACTPKEIRLANRCLASTVLLHLKVARADGKRGMGTCSGVYVSPNMILTANHCVEMEEGLELKEIWVRNYNGDSARATVVKASPLRDLALIKTDLKGIPVRLARKIRVGEDCWIVGQPLGLEFVVTKGIVSSINVETAAFPINHFITDCVVLPGNSGGPAFDNHGNLIGILTMSTSAFGPFGASGLGIVVQVDEVRSFLKNTK
jgi:serine protease Do